MKSFRNPSDPSTLGNRYLDDKFSRSVHMDGISQIIRKPTNNPAPGEYIIEKSDFNQNETDFAYKLPLIPREKRNLDKVLLKRDAHLIPDPSYYQTSTYLSGDYGTNFNVKKKTKNFSVPKAARHYDPRVYAKAHSKEYSKGIMM